MSQLVINKNASISLHSGDKDRLKCTILQGERQISIIGPSFVLFLFPISSKLFRRLGSLR